ncbi:MAG TPA: hypothetical protein PK880_06715 [Candidatus Competibacter sp.]|nr:hypothetical protein [Candidatus Competibacter sp.]
MNIPDPLPDDVPTLKATVAPWRRDARVFPPARPEGVRARWTRTRTRARPRG